MINPYFCVVGLLALCSFVRSEQSYNTEKEVEEADDSQVYVYPTGFKGGRYYYGGIYRGACHNDGLYYRDEDRFVICSNGNGYVQPCAPGTKSSGQHRYSPGYYYGYSDFCDINLVDQGYGPEHYAPYGVPTYNKDLSYGTQESTYDVQKPTNYDKSHETYHQEAAPEYRYGGYQNEKYTGYGTQQDIYDKDGYGQKRDNYRKDSYSKDSYTKGHAYNQQAYGGSDSYEQKETAYEPNSKYSR